MHRLRTIQVPLRQEINPTGAEFHQLYWRKYVKIVINDSELISVKAFDKQPGRQFHYRKLSQNRNRFFFKASKYFLWWFFDINHSCHSGDCETEECECYVLHVFTHWWKIKILTGKNFCCLHCKRNSKNVRDIDQTWWPNPAW